MWSASLGGRSLRSGRALRQPLNSLVPSSTADCPLVRSQLTQLCDLELTMCVHRSYHVDVILLNLLISLVDLVLLFLSSNPGAAG